MGGINFGWLAVGWRFAKYFRRLGETHVPGGVEWWS